jgi:tetratricopeptide (TPR) repeat protein
LSVLAVGILPGIIFLFRDQVFLVSDKFVWALHRDYIGEFQSLPEKIDYDYISMFLPILLGFPLLGVATLRLLLIKNIPPTWKSALLLCVIPGVCLSALAFLQVRWMGVAHALWLALLPLWVACLASRFCHKAIRRPEILLYILVFGATIFQFPRVIVESFVACYGKNELPSPAEAFGMVIREMCHKMRRNHEGNEPICILGGPTTTTWMMYYGGFKGLGTLYWENKNGLMAAASIYNARTEEEALNLVKEHHITHLAVFSLDPFVFQYPRLLRGLPFGSKPHDAFLPRILDEFIVPKWMNPIYYPLPDLFNGQWVCLYEMKPGQKEADWFSSFARFYGDRGDHEKALAKYADSLKAEPHQPDLEVEYARMLFLSGKRADGEKWLSEGLAGRPPAQAAQTCYMIGKDCMDASRNKEALALARQALRANPQLPEAKHLAAWLMATSSDLDVHCPKEALALASDNADLRDRVAYLDALAAAHAANLHFIVAVRFGQEAVDQAIASHASKQVVEALQARLKMYGESKKFIAR